MDESKEKTLLLDRRYECPVCKNEFKSKSVKTGAAKLIDTELDLRPRYQNIDPVKYDVVVCPKCGYAALAKYFPNLTAVQKKYIMDKVKANFKRRNMDYEYYDYDTAMGRYKLALLSTMVKITEPSELGYVCLKISWMLQNRKDSVTADGKEGEELKNKYYQEAMQYSKKALEYLTQARMEEEYPICGMDMPTLDYLLAALAYLDGQTEFAMRMLGTVASSREATDRLKDKAYDLKQLLTKKSEKI